MFEYLTYFHTITFWQLENSDRQWYTLVKNYLDAGNSNAYVSLAQAMKSRNVLMNVLVSRNAQLLPLPPEFPLCDGHPTLLHHCRPFIKSPSTKRFREVRTSYVRATLGRGTF
jgi:hypothetical protein